MGIGWPAQQGIRIDTGVMGVDAGINTTEITFGPFPAEL
jgi:hypothetical protein